MWKIIKRLSPGMMTAGMIFAFVQVGCVLYLPYITADIVDGGVMAGNAAYKRKSPKSIPLALDMVGLPNIEKKKVYQLSGGEQQRIALARIILKDPKYIFADEPTGNLDKENRDIVISILQALNKQSKTVVLVTHDMELAQKAHRQISL